LSSRRRTLEPSKRRVLATFMPRVARPGITRTGDVQRELSERARFLGPNVWHHPAVRRAPACISCAELRWGGQPCGADHPTFSATRPRRVVGRAAVSATQRSSTVPSGWGPTRGAEPHAPVVSAEVTGDEDGKTPTPGSRYRPARFTQAFSGDLIVAAGIRLAASGYRAPSGERGSADPGSPCRFLVCSRTVYAPGRIHTSLQSGAFRAPYQHPDQHRHARNRPVRG
jgi:peptidoglycan hydrolase-like protein with peptidoglycan-binding domain